MIGRCRIPSSLMVMSFISNKTKIWWIWILLKKRAREDLIKKTVATFPWSIGVFGGYNLSLASFGTSVSDYTPLNVFNHHEKSAQFNPTYGIDLSRRFWSFPAMSGKHGIGSSCRRCYERSEYCLRWTQS
jgi:hypothetical protein